ncbi:Maltose-binding protein MalE [Marinitoga hydrogenitolerans DSM 16785]|uniref:Maltose-binding protein MalE n=1 Tax=Marinitoga hydrogenitolerans (strain DSM 16785 / JCM 12826 / AT1271) TaxID=1122195 RepID=A0A1M4YCR4_MARH1|nr:extracellular solute-binding protein [Marinitoga hydrogenitolerans]SHF03517.1 Maltose-binding protein MalE [Marinitoga hydrogenitolerans DSM 16785]
MNRYIVLIFFTLLLTISFSRTINIWFEYEGGDQLKAIVKEFEKENPSISINIIQQKKIPDKLFTVFRGNGDIPDIILIKNDDIGKLIDAGLIENVDDIKNQIEKNLIQNTFDGFKIEKSGKEHYYGVPFYFDTQVLYYNNKIFNEAGVSLDDIYSFEDLLLASQVIEEYTKGKVLGFAWGANSPYWFPPFQWAFGKENLIENGRIIINDQETLDAVKYIYKAIIKENAYWIERQGLIAGFKSGKIASMFFGTFMIPDFIKSGMNFKILPLPYIKEAENYMASILDYKGFSIVKGKKTKDVEKLIEFILSKEAQIDFCKGLYKFPVNKSAFDELKDKDEYFKVVYESAKRGKTMPNSSYFKSKYWQGIRTMMTLILNQKEGFNNEIIEKTQRFMDEK